MSQLSYLRADIDAWVSAVHPGADFVFDGGQRLVYRVGGNTPSALKVWRVSDRDQHERHVREVSALARLDHPGLPRVLAHVGQVDIGGQLLAFYEEEWLDAPTIRDLRASLPLSETDARAFLVSALGVLVALHSANIVHRDISVGNVLWDSNQTRIIDLGLAKHLDLDSLTSTGAQLGRTILSASPEQLQGASTDLRTPTDIFSLGVVGFLVLTGRHPFIEPNEHVDIATLLHRQLSRDIRGCPKSDIGRSIEKMLDPVSFYRPIGALLLEDLLS